MFTDKDELARSLDKAIAKHRIPGASIAIFSNGHTVEAACGVANVETGVSMTAETLLHIGSITKILNATLVMQLVDEGRVELDNPITDYLHDLGSTTYEKDRITVRMLLNHSSGIDGEMLPDHGHDQETIKAAIARFAELPQLFPPGTEFSYCNAGSVLAGYLVQTLRQSSWYDVVRERIFEPLQMRHSAALPEEALLHRAGVGHFRSGQGGEPVRTGRAFLPMSFSPAGTTLMTSAGDLLRFALAHLRGGVGERGDILLTKASADTMRSTSIDNAENAYAYVDRMGLGWMIHGDGLLTHVGGGPGTFAAIFVHPRSAFAATILTNAENGLELISDFIDPLLEGIGAAKPFSRDIVSNSAPRIECDLDAYVGIYEDVVDRYVVTLDGGNLLMSKQVKFKYYDTVSTSPTEPKRLVHLSGNDFSVAIPGPLSPIESFSNTISFKNSGEAGQMLYLGHSLRLHKRVD